MYGVSGQFPVAERSNADHVIEPEHSGQRFSQQHFCASEAPTKFGMPGGPGSGLGISRAPSRLFVPTRSPVINSTEWEADSSSLRTVELANQGLCELPQDIGPLDRITALDLSGNDLTVFPADQLLGMTSLQEIKLSMEQATGKPERKSRDGLAREGIETIEVLQGNHRAKVISMAGSPRAALYTTSLDTCLALCAMQNDTALLIHIDTFSAQGWGRVSTRDVLTRHLAPNVPDTRIMLVGANGQGSAANVRGVLSVLKELGLERCVTMASLGNGHTSAMLDIGARQGQGQAYVGRL
jgi:hypothetical protein